MVSVRQAKQSDVRWIDICYKEIGFVPSDFSTEIICIAWFGKRRAGLGRLVPLENNSLELGGIYVKERFRNKGIATNVISALLTRQRGNIVYCIPFKKLEDFYKSFGFINCQKKDAPLKIQEKIAFCKKTYPEPVILLIKK